MQVEMGKDEARTQQCTMMRICGDNCVSDDGKSDNGAQWQKVWDEDGVSRLCCGESIDYER